MNSGWSSSWHELLGWILPEKRKYIKLFIVYLCRRNKISLELFDFELYPQLFLKCVLRRDKMKCCFLWITFVKGGFIRIE